MAKEIRPRRGSVARFTAVAMLLLALSGSSAFAQRPTVEQLTKARLASVQGVYAQMTAAHAAGLVDLDSVYRWSVRWYEAERAGKKNPAAARAHAARMQALAGKVQAAVWAGVAKVADAQAALYYRAEAELWEAEALQP